MQENYWDTFVKGNIETRATGLIEHIGNREKIDYWWVKVFVNIIAQAGKDRDVPYFTSWVFRIHCKVLDIDHMTVYRSIQHIWQLEDSQ